MRRKEKEVTDAELIREIIMACDCCRLGFRDGNGVYIVPLNFGYDDRGEKQVFYFHGATKGKKIDLITELGYAGFELDTNHKVNEHDIACEYSFRYQSVIGEGPISIITDREEKREALLSIMAHYSSQEHWDFPDAALNATAVFKLEVKGMTCKEHH